MGVSLATATAGTSACFRCTAGSGGPSNLAAPTCVGLESWGLSSVGPSGDICEKEHGAMVPNA
jgi:hypothetical protein